jgi:hypothetical protein
MITKINSLKVINDSARRGIALITTVSKEKNGIASGFGSPKKIAGGKQENSDFTANTLIVR